MHVGHLSLAGFWHLSPTHTFVEPSEAGIIYMGIIQARKGKKIMNLSVPRVHQKILLILLTRRRDSSGTNFQHGQPCFKNRFVCFRNSLSSMSSMDLHGIEKTTLYWNGHPEIVRHLLEHGANVNGQQTRADCLVDRVVLQSKFCPQGLTFQSVSDEHQIGINCAVGYWPEFANSGSKTPNTD